jgi:hypothetical protein
MHIRTNTFDEIRCCDIFNGIRQTNNLPLLILDLSISIICDKHTIISLKTRNCSYSNHPRRINKLPKHLSSAEMVGFIYHEEDPIQALVSNFFRCPTQREYILGNFNFIGISIFNDEYFHYATILFVLIDLKQVSFLSSRKEEQKNVYFLLKLFNDARRQLMGKPYLINQHLYKIQKHYCEDMLKRIHSFPPEMFQTKETKIEELNDEILFYG